MQDPKGKESSYIHMHGSSYSRKQCIQLTVGTDLSIWLQNHQDRKDFKKLSGPFFTWGWCHAQVPLSWQSLSSWQLSTSTSNGNSASYSCSSVFSSLDLTMWFSPVVFVCRSSFHSPVIIPSVLLLKVFFWIPTLSVCSTQHWAPYALPGITTEEEILAALWSLNSCFPILV